MRKRGFEKISFEQFKKDIKNDLDLYNSYKLPKRGTKYSAGYDFYAVEDFIIKPKEILKVPTGVKFYAEGDDVLLIVVRGSTGIKYNVRMTNQVGVIESDYYNNETNEGHMWVCLQNEGDKDFVIKQGDAFVQGIFTKFLVTDDDDASGVRVGWLGSTNKKL